MKTADHLPPVLDACCSVRSFWFDRSDERVIFVDKRSGITIIQDAPNSKEHGRREYKVVPDVVCDFTVLPFPSETFAHVVFDPPHMTNSGDTGHMTAHYGKLTGGWQEMLRKGFAECFRVLRPEGTLIFKWNERDILVSDVLALTPEKPLYGHRSGKRSQTIWVAFLKSKTSVKIF